VKPTLLLLASLLLAAGLHAETLAEKDLREAVAREKEMFARAQNEGDNLDKARFQAELQSLVSTYDVIIQKNPDFAPGYVAYGVFLSRVGMAKEAAAILLKANKLDPNVPIVKNQLAMLLAEDGRPLDALPWLMAAIELSPQEPLYHYHLGKLLAEARDEFIKSGEWQRPALDRAMLSAFTKAAELAPGDWTYAYRHAEAYYDLETPRWDEALKLWTALEEKAKPGIEQETIRLHAANILLKLGDKDRAQSLLLTVTAAPLQKQKQTLLDQLAKPAEK
jgi:tetratricopeptide (TPR) repeat protein